MVSMLINDEKEEGSESVVQLIRERDLVHVASTYIFIVFQIKVT